MVKFDEFPIELITLILELAFSYRNFGDRPTAWFANLALTSRTMNTAITPILYRAMYITKRNYPAILNMCRVRWYLQDIYPPPREQVNHVVSAISRKLVRGVMSKFGSKRSGDVAWDKLATNHTRRLVLLDSDAHLDTVALAFVCVTEFAGTSKQANELSVGSRGQFRPDSLLMTDEYTHSRVETLSIAPHVTHLHICVPFWNQTHSTPIGLRCWPSLTLTHVMIHYHIEFDYTTAVLEMTEHFLGIPTLARLAICVVPHDGYCPPWVLMTERLIEFLRSRRETRVIIVYSEYLRKRCPCYPSLQDMNIAFDREWPSGLPQNVHLLTSLMRLERRLSELSEPSAASFSPELAV